MEHQSKFYRKKDIEVGAYIKMALDQGEYRRNFSSTTQLRLHFKEHLLVSLGLEDWDMFQDSPQTLSSYFSYGKKLEKGRVSFNAYLSYNRQIKFLNGVKLYIVRETDDFNGVVEIKNKNSFDPITAEANSSLNSEAKDGKGDKTESLNPVSHEVSFNIYFNKKMDEDTVVGGSFNYDVNSKSSDAELMCAKRIDRVKLIGKVATDRSLTFGIESNFDDISLIFATKSTLGCKTDKIGEHEVTKHWVDYKFGVALGFNRI
eukprot:CAMPEP_0170520676 /NCGR_PEP_ID=MMETSP0209-20121228/6007_1 /TAXON_ID=665100 ORGANISM="Litonotus pictus, Strain P1" /NCGR_SAMPLE_ID=MMETSP0209 /ASSEMBLY_ACC=CAM_ASM_000301 /LENGTH=259 /DNA_ID=CAMNT_0010807143 /DNA_START=249 /DNA_END=1028 /DNA_ORIENTATION=-